jgi:hypothetical protein
MKRILSQNNQNLSKRCSSEVSAALLKLDSGNVFFNLGDSSTVLLRSDCIRATSELFPESAIRNLMIKSMVDAESRSAGGSYIALRRIAGEKFDEKTPGRRFKLFEIERSLKVLIGDLAADIVFEATKLAGRDGKIMLDSSDVQKTEITYGTQICKWKPDQKFFEAIGQQRASAQNCKVVFIDGIIESVAECHRLFQDSYDLHVPVVIFARGYSEEVIATAAVNFQRRTAHVIPITIHFDEVGVNSMADLAGCFSSEVISSDKGQLISNVKIIDFPLAERMSVSSAGTEIEFQKSDIDAVVERLTSRLKSCEDQQADLIRRRIDALGTGAVTIKIGSDKKSIAGIQRDRVDFGLRYVRSCMQSGVIDVNGFLMPRRSIDAGVHCADSFLQILKRNGAILEVDRCG